MSSEDDILDLLDRAGRLSYYQMLGLPHRYATPAEVKNAFHEFAQLYHPDLYHDADDHVRLAAKEVFKRAVEAYEVLRDALLQRRYVENFLKKGLVHMPPAEFSRRAAIAAGGRPNSIPPPKPEAPPKQKTWADEMKTDDGREVATRIERMIGEGRYQAALQQMALLTSIEGDTAAVRSKRAYLQRMVDRSR